MVVLNFLFWKSSNKAAIDPKILYELSLAKFERQIAEFGQDRMKKEVAKLKIYAEKCNEKPSICNKSKFTTVRDSPDLYKVMQLTHFKGEKIGKKIDRNYGKFLSSGLNGCIFNLWTNNSIYFYSILVIERMSEFGGSCPHGLWTSISDQRKRWPKPKCRISNQAKWWTKKWKRLTAFRTSLSV